MTILAQLRNANADFTFLTADGSVAVQYSRRTTPFTMPHGHSHITHELYYLFTGERDYFIRDRTHRVRAGDFVFIEKGELHRTLDTGAPEHERAVFYFTDRLLEGLPPALRAQSGVVRLPEAQRARGEMLAWELVAESAENRPGRDGMIEAMLKQIVLLVFRAAAEKRAASGKRAEPAAPTPLHRMMSEAAAYVGEHYAEPLTLAEVAEKFFISPYYLSRKFKECTGFGFHEYVQLVRVREAKRLLVDTDWKMIEIAERTGFGQVATFHRLFKRVAGCSPLQYRKRHRGADPRA